jgi:uncharacterized RDD family membrane protein YckC
MAKDDAVRSGYLSEEDKQRFTLLAGVLGAVFFFLQFLVPMVAMFAVMPAVMFDWRITRFEIDGSALYHGQVHLVETTLSAGAGSEGASHGRLVRLGPERIEEVAPLEGWTPRLLAQGDRLWLVSSDRMAVLEDERLRTLSVAEPLGDTCRPFLLDGAPAVLERRPDRVRLLRWDQGTWREVGPVAGVRDVCSVQALDTERGPLLLREDGDSLYSTWLTADDREWTVALSSPDRWRLLEQDDVPTVVSLDRHGLLRIVRLERDRWTQAVHEQVSQGGIGGEVAAFETSAGGPLTVVSQGFPGSLRVRSWDGHRLIEAGRYGRTSFFPGGMGLFMFLPHLGSMAMSLVLAVILAALMRRHRVTTHEYEGRVVAQASLTRRALAQLVDGAILGLPFALVFWSFFSDFETIAEEGPAFPVRLFLKMAAAMAWTVLALAGLAVTEGLWGWTPGKLVTGIRVVGTDLRPCGIGRAIVRNLLKAVDGFFNFLIGILMVAFTPQWQRLGDMAARTIVIRPGPRHG